MRVRSFQIPPLPSPATLPPALALLYPASPAPDVGSHCYCCCRHSWQYCCQWQWEWPLCWYSGMMWKSWYNPCCLLFLWWGLGLQKVINIYILIKHKVLGVMTRRAFWRKRELLAKPDVPASLELGRDQRRDRMDMKKRGQWSRLPMAIIITEECLVPSSGNRCELAPWGMSLNVIQAFVWEPKDSAFSKGTWKRNPARHGHTWHFLESPQWDWLKHMHYLCLAFTLCIFPLNVSWSWEEKNKEQRG